MAGFHYRFSVNVGARMGNKVAKKIVDTQLRRRHRRVRFSETTHRRGLAIWVASAKLRAVSARAQAHPR
jgi:hypothetical protein